MKALLSGKILAVALVAVVLTACGGSDDDDDNSSSSSAPASVAASSVATSEAASSVAASEAASSAATSEAVSSVAMSEAASSVAMSEAASSVATSEAASSVMESSSSEATSSAAAAALVIYEENILANWTAWDCCRGSTPVALVASEVDHGKAAQFSILGDGQTVVGFSSRTGHGAVGGAVFDATSIKTTGTISFDLKLITAASAGAVDWKFKVESNGGGAGNAAEVDLTDNSQEGHAAPVLNTWQTYTFNISALETAGVNVAGLDVFMIFPAWGTGTGAVFQVDNVKIWSTGAVTPE
jgi:hypothetical protein